MEELYAALARGDVSAALALIDSDARWVTPSTLPWSQGEYAGPDGVAQYFRSFAEALDDAVVEPHELIDGGDSVVALGEERAIVRSTGARFAVPFAHVIRIRDGRVTELCGHVDTAAIATAFADSH